jgi:hypothetical protein
MKKFLFVFIGSGFFSIHGIVNKSAVRSELKSMGKGSTFTSINHADESQNFSLFLMDAASPSDSVYTPPANNYDEVAKRLAGLYIDPHNSDQLKYAKFINEKWEELSDASLSRIPCWRAVHMDPRMPENATVLFYPFGGPDILYARFFFPRMDVYILVGLEPIGTFANIEKNMGNTSTLTALKRALSSYFKKGYFITSEMMTQLSNQNARGALYPILIGLVRNGCTVNLVEDLSIDPEGREVVRQKGMLDCVKIVFTSAEGGFPKNVYYIRADLTNSNKKLPHLMNFVKRAPFATLIKSASYVLHDRVASGIRNFVLENSLAILQDDTGIPFSYFGQNWQMYPFGTYTEPPLRIFKNYRQKGLSEFFSSRNFIEIPFKIGYGFNQGRPNLIFAIIPKRAKEQFFQRKLTDG